MHKRRRLAPPAPAVDQVRAATDILRHEISFMWRIHTMSYLMLKPGYRNITEGFGLSLIDWRITLTLAHCKGLTAQEIIEIWGLEKMAVSRAVQHLLKLGLIRRGRDPNDGRRRPLSLTAKGERLHNAAWPGAEQHYNRITSVLTREEFGIFLRISDKLITKAREIVDEYFPKERT